MQVVPNVVKKAGVSFLARTIVFLALLYPVGACMPDGQYVRPGDGGSSGTGGTGTVPACTGVPSTSDKATWENVKFIVNGDPYAGGGCFGSDCHTQGDREPYLFGLNSVPLSDADLYTKLTTYTSKTETCAGRPLITPCQPDQSLFYKIQTGGCGDLEQMPFGCKPEYDNCTPADKLEGLRQWIAKGAPRP